jgi:hypothetical protein
MLSVHTKIGLVFLRLGSSQRNVQDRLGVSFLLVLNQSMVGVFALLQVFGAEITLFNREYSSRLYSVSAFFLSKTLSDLPFQVCVYTAALHTPLLSVCVWCEL